MGLKARVKATGEIVDIYRFVDTEQNEWIDCYLDFLEPIDTDYWTRLEHQYAGMAMQGLMTILPNIGGLEGRTPKDEIVDIAMDIAHALVEKMKEERK